MCTAAIYKSEDFYFGRTLDYETSYGDEVVITPRNYPFHFLHKGDSYSHYAIIGMACVMNGYPLYYDAVKEKGLCIAGLNFVGNACYRSYEEGKDNIAQYELIPWLLGRCGSVSEVKCLIERINIIATPFEPMLPAAQLHWMIADKEQCVVMEAMESGLHLYDNPVGVLTNNPPFPMQMFALNNYRHVSPYCCKSSFAPGLELKDYSRGLGGLGLPGDLSSQSRFVRAAFVKMNSISGSGEEQSVSQFFHILNSVDQPRGCCDLGKGKYEVTIYTSCCNADKGIYYYTSYDCHQINAIDMHREDLNGCELISYEAIKEENVNRQN